MKIVLLNVTYGVGSTGKIIESLYHSYSETGHDVRVIYGRKSIKTDDSFIIKGGFDLESKIHHAISLLTGNIYGGSFFSTFHIIRLLKKIKPDAVHIHCINGYFVNVFMLLKYLKKNHIRTILTNHAEFYYTGNCGYALKCNNWRCKKCKNCSRIQEFNGKLSLNLTHHYWKKMFYAVKDFNELTVTSVSPWLNERSKESEIFRTKENVCIVNPVEIKNVSDEEQLQLLKAIIGIPADNKIVLHLTADYYNPEKGGNLFMNRICELLKNEKITFLVKSSKKINEANKKNLIFIKDDEIKSINDLYAIADCTLLLSKSETFSMVTAESLCSGTPVIGFKAGGPESIAPSKYSKFVDYGNIELLANEIKLCLSKKNNRDEIKKESNIIFNKNNISEKYLNLLKEEKSRNQMHKEDKLPLLFSLFFVLFLSLCVIANAIPFFESNTIAGAILRIITLSLAVAFYLIVYLQKKSPPNILPFALCVIGIILSSISVFTISHSALDYSTWKDLQSIFYPVELLFLTTLFSKVFFKSFVGGNKLNYLFYAICIFSIGFSIYSLTDQILNSSLAGNYFYYPHRNFNGFILAVLFSYIIILSQSVNKNKVTFPIILLLFVSTLITLSKTAIFGVIVTSIVYSLINIKKHNKTSIGYLSTLFVFITIYLVVMNIPDLRTNSVINIIYTSTYSQIEKTIESRITTFTNEIVPFINWKLILGYGYSYSNDIIKSYLDNHYLQIIFSNGLLGLLVIILFYAKSFKMCHQLFTKNKNVSILIITINCFIMISGLFLSVGPLSVGLFLALLVPIQFTMPILMLKNNDTKEIKVLHIVNSFLKGGTESFILNYANALKEKNIIIDVYCCGSYDNEQRKKLENIGGHFYKGEIFSIKKYLNAYHQLNHYLNGNQYDIVHLDANFDNYSFAIVASSNYINSIIFHSHDSLANINYSLFKKIYNKIKIFICKIYCNCFLACSKDAGRDLLGNIFFSINGCVIKNIIDFNYFAYPNKEHAMELKREWNLKSDDIIFGNITRFESKKNQEFIIDTFKIINTKSTNTKLLLGGPDGGQLKYIKNKVDLLGLNDSVIFIGSRNDIPDCLSIIDFYLFPSLFEGFGIALLENQISGITTISSKFIPENVDLNLGLLHKLDLFSDHWASFILSLKSKKINIEDRFYAFVKKGFNDTSTLENIYIINKV